MAARAAIPQSGCRFTESFTELKSAAQIPLWHFGVRKYWCWNAHRRRVDANPKVFVDVRVPQAAAISGWKYDGLDKNGKYDNLFRCGAVTSAGASGSAVGRERCLGDRARCEALAVSSSRQAGEPRRP
jgi:hypothetical protein